MSTTRLRRIFLTFIGVCIWCIIVIPVVIKIHDPELREVKNSLPDYVPEGYTLLEDELKDKKAFSDYVDQFSNSNQNVTCNLLYGKQTIIKGQPINSVSLTIPIIYGTIRDYPLEQYYALLTAICLDSKKKSIPLSIFVDKSLVSHTPEIQAELIKNGNNKENFLGTYDDLDAIAIAIELATPSSSKAFSFFLMAVMWGLAIPYGIITYDYVISRREVPPPLIAVGVSILFALPSIRNSQPGSPVMGCLADYIAFFWCIGIIAVCIMFNLFSYALRWRKPVSDLTK
ncbi:hypothetical protein K502DRAFT_293289 [Neoconidiobolus thromboides FSU 785]|nr:hypothetical protein K502DRAFT_293289 [Neoconidiobolus thromboides FSU 785]